MNSTVGISVIIVNYNTRELLRNCLRSVFEKTEGVSFEVIVSDNGSEDGSIEMVKQEFPQVVLLENRANLDLVRVTTAASTWLVANTFFT